MLDIAIAVVIILIIITLFYIRREDMITESQYNSLFRGFNHSNAGDYADLSIIAEAEKSNLDSIILGK